MSKAKGSIFITGAGSGMGRLAARNYAEDGYEVAAVDINEHGWRQQKIIRISEYST